MTLQSPAAYQQNASHSAELFRQVISAILGVPNPTTLDASAGGVVSRGDMEVTANGTPNMSVNIAAGAAFIPGTQAGSQSLYFALNDATVNVAIAAADPTNERWDLVCVSVEDSFYAGSADEPYFQVVTGTPAVSPVVPATPDNSLVLATVLVPAGTTEITGLSIPDERFSVVGGQSALSLFGIPGASLTGGSFNQLPPNFSNTLGWFPQGAGNKAVTTNSSGWAKIPFPNEYPNGTLLAFVQTCGTVAEPWYVRIDQANTTTDQVAFWVYAAGSPLDSTVVDLCWFAIGW